MIVVTAARGRTGRSPIQMLSEGESVLAFVSRERDLPFMRSLGAQEALVGSLHRALPALDTVRKLNAVPPRPDLKCASAP